MKSRLTLMSLLFVWTSQALSQSISTPSEVANQVGPEICNCLGNVLKPSLLNQKFDECLADELAIWLADSTHSIGPMTVEGIREVSTAIRNYAHTNCPSFRQAQKEAAQSEHYRGSKIVEANLLYDEGNELMGRQDYEGAIDKFKAAVKLDREFVFAIDHIAICYRQLGEYKKALRYYKKSLRVYPEGSLAWLNTAVLYSLLEKPSKALQAYEKLQEYHPENPEGYFGAARIHLYNGDLEDALKNSLTAFVLYSQQGSPYLKDGEKLLTTIVTEMSMRGMTEEIKRIGEEQNVNLNINVTIEGQ